ncbi:MAG TPA: hypothetical protein VGL13_15220 [Polyangiaceae bacterium]
MASSLREADGETSVSVINAERSRAAIERADCQLSPQLERGELATKNDALKAVDRRAAVGFDASGRRVDAQISIDPGTAST